MKFVYWPILLLVAVAMGGCHKSDQSIQAENAASSSPSTSSAPPPTSAAAASDEQANAPGPLLPLASANAVEEGSARTDVPKADATAAAPAPTVGRAAPADAPAKPLNETRKSGPSPGSAPVVKLIKAGAEPHQKLRLEAKVGQSEKMKMVMDMNMDINLGGRAAPKASLPPMVMSMVLSVTDVKPNGDIRYDFELTKSDVGNRAGVAPQVAAAMKDALGKMVGMNGYAVVSDRGFNKDAALKLPPGADAQTQQVMAGMEQAMQQLSAPLPEEPVGIGAQWELRQALSQNGIAIQQVATYDLVGIDDKLITANVTLKQTAPSQTVNLPTGDSMKLVSLNSDGSGDLKMRLDRLTPTASKMNLTSRAKMEIAAPKKQSMAMTTRITIDITPE